MSRWIEIDGEVLAKIGERAEPFADSPNDVLRSAFGLGVGERPTCAPLPSESPPKSVRRSRARVGDLLPQDEYALPLLTTLADFEGSASRSQVLAALEVTLADRLTALDRCQLQSGEIRWRNRVGFARLRAIDRGHMRSDSRRAIWELTEAGKRVAAQAESKGEERETDEERPRRPREESES